MNLKYTEKLEYASILNTLSGYCVTDFGKNLCFHLTPSSSKTEVITLLQETSEAIGLFSQKEPPITNINSIDTALKSLERNGTLTLSSILELAKTLKVSSLLKDYFYLEHDSNTFPIMNSYFSKLYGNPSIVETIERSIVDENTVSDSASHKLCSIRKEIRKLEETINETLHHFIHSSTHSKYVQENVITIRNSRYVIPIKEEYRSMVKGFVHDISASRFYCIYRTNVSI